MRPPLARAGRAVPPLQAACRFAEACTCERPARTLQPRRSGRCARAVREWIADAVTLHASPERHARDAERRGGALPVPAMIVQDAQDAGALVRPEAAVARWGGAHRGGEVIAGCGREDQERLERVLQLADVAGPGMVEKRTQLCGRRHDEARPVTPVERGDEVADEQRKIGPTLPKRRQLDGEHPEPVVEIPPEGAGLDHAPELAI